MKGSALTGRLSALKRGLEGCRHGGIVLTGDNLEAFIEELSELCSQARALELGPMLPAREIANLAQGPSADVLAAMRSPNSNIALFPVSAARPSFTSFGSGDDAC